MRLNTCGAQAFRAHDARLSQGLRKVDDKRVDRAAVDNAGVLHEDEHIARGAKHLRSVVRAQLAHCGAGRRAAAGRRALRRAGRAAARRPLARAVRIALRRLALLRPRSLTARLLRSGAGSSAPLL
eukprot:399117-Pleurochrysis_carterae.AAC.2